MHVQEYEKPLDVLLQRQNYIQEILQLIVNDFPFFSFDNKHICLP